MTLSNKTVVYLVLFSCVFIANVIAFILAYRPFSLLEHFVAEEDVELRRYAFDSLKKYLNRDPTDDELHKVVALGTREKIDIQIASNDIERDLKSFIVSSFDKRFQRNPTMDEIQKYIVLGSREAIERQLAQDFSVDGKLNVQIQETKEEPEPVKKPVERDISTNDSRDSLQSNSTFQQAMDKTFEQVDKMQNVTLSKTFVYSKIDAIQKQLDDLKRLM